MRCGRPFEHLDFCFDDENVLNLASTGHIIGNWEVTYGMGRKVLNITRMCEVPDDCYDLISHWNLMDSFRSALELTCTSNGMCKSTNSGLWTNGTITGEEFCEQEVLMEDIFDAPETLRDRSFKRYVFPSFCPRLADCVRCKAGPTVEKCDTDWNINTISGATGSFPPVEVAIVGGVTNDGQSQCLFCPKASDRQQCPPERYWYRPGKIF